MKAGIHPDYKDAVFLDTSTGHKFLSRTTMTSKEKVKWEDGKEYPLIRVDISAYSHPYFTGKMKYVDAAGRVEKFQKKYKWAQRKGAEGGREVLSAGEHPVHAVGAVGKRANAVPLDDACEWRGRRVRAERSELHV